MSLPFASKNRSASKRRTKLRDLVRPFTSR
jgi:hypothetical protein